jgi:hypothetical protein
MRRSWRCAVVVVAIGALGLAACGGDDDDSSSDTTKASSDTTAAASDTTAGGSDTTAGSSDTTAAPSPYKATATPTDGLADGAAVTVSVEGFTAGKTLGINECAQQGDADVGAEDCDLGGIVTITVGSDGTGTGTINVKKSGIGSNAHDCADPTTRCFLSVGELTADANAERSDDVNLKFA